jgi:hypothetical protein
MRPTFADVLVAAALAVAAATNTIRETTHQASLVSSMDPDVLR